MSLKSAVKKTIDYAAIFGSHINKNEIKQRLISKRIFKISRIDTEIGVLNWKNKKNKWRKIKITKAKRLANLIKNNFEEILFLGVTGSVASGHPQQDDDIDILIITKSNALWKNRFKLRWWINKNKIPHRKYNSIEKKDQFCFNLWLDENFLEIPNQRQNLQNAMDLILLIPLLNRNNIYEKFILSNKWATKFVATGYNRIVKDLRFKNNDLRIEQNFILRNVSNMMYFWPQYWYMKKKIRGEMVNLHQAFFHGPMIK